LVVVLREGWLTETLHNLSVEYLILQNKFSYDPFFLWNLMKVILSRKIDIIHAHEFAMNVYGSVAAKLTGRPMIGTVHGKIYFTEKRSRILSYKLAVSLCSNMVLVSEDLKEFFVANLKLRNRKKLLTIYNGVDLKKYDSDHGIHALRTELSLPPDAVIACNIGSLFQIKGLPYLLEAAKLILPRHPNFRLLIAGEGNQFDDLKSMAARLGLEMAVIFLGFRNDVPAILRLSDFYICSSLSEGLSLSILEAMAAGKSVLATNVGGNPELIKNGENGFLVPPSDPAALAEKITFLIENLGLRQSMGEISRGFAQDRFSLTRMMADYQNLYEELLAGRA
jgi:glycosyltransferase involved in cell wall biosynthesis